MTSLRLITLLVGALTAFAAPLPSAAAPAPGPLTLMRRVVDAYDNLGPATIKATLVAQGPNHPKYVMTSETLRNGPEAMAVTLTANGRVVREYVSGSNKALYDETRRQYVTGSFYLRPDPVYEAIDLFRIALRNPLAVEPLRNAVVEPIIFLGEPAIRMKWKGLPPKGGSGTAPDMTLIVGRDDYFPRKIATVGARGANRVVTASVRREDKPFPADTFAFVPPPYATRAGNNTSGPAPAVPPADLLPVPKQATP